MAIKASSQLSLIDLTDAYSVFLTSEAHTFMGSLDSVAGTQTTTTQIIAYLGNEPVSCSVGTITGATGISAVSDNKTPSPTITITATSALKNGGTIDIPVIIDNITIVKKFSYSIAFTGKGISSTTVTYVKSTNGTTAPTSGWGTTIPSLSAGEYLWTKTVITYTDGTSSTSYSVGMKGQNGANGANGAAGADAISMVIESSGGIIFKNTAIATTLTARVYKGGVEVTGSALTALGTIKWYKDGGTTAVGTGSTLTITAGQITNRANYTAQLEA